MVEKKLGGGGQQLEPFPERSVSCHFLDSQESLRTSMDCSENALDSGHTPRNYLNFAKWRGGNILTICKGARGNI